MLYLLIENENLISVCDYLPNVGTDNIKIIKYDGKIPADRIIYLDGLIKDLDNYLFLNNHYVPKNKTLVEQEKINNTSRKYLYETDWLVTRHRDQLDLGISTSLTSEEFLNLLQKRQEARKKVVDYDG